MSRLALFALVLTVGCSKSAGTKEKPDDTLATTGNDRVAVPGAKGAPTTEGAVGGGDEKRFRLQPEEGALAIEAPTGAKAGTETIAKIVVTPGSEFKVNTEFPTKLTLENADGVTIAKATLIAGGQDKAKGDAEVFEESKLVFGVKLTPAKSGSYTINGSFKFAVCDKAGSTCLAKKEPIVIQLPAR
ncbi:MAG: hypothetical protein M4D80_04105 [Myxococcota bacterium]|nr:hypothetical protein [Myxococcota bacterium]